MQAYLKTLRAWADTNPLRVFRRTQRARLPAVEAAIMMDVGIATINYWEIGASYPLPENMEKLVKFLRDPDLPDKWQAWYSQRPAL